MAILIISTATESYSYELPTEVGAAYNIGSGADCQISVPGVDGLAEVHCSITCMEDGYVITDAGSPAGTLAQDRKVESEYMSPELVYIAGELTIAIADSEPAATETPAEDGSPATVKKTTKRTTAKKANKGAALSLEELKAAAAQFDRSKNKNARMVNMIYIIIVLLAAFYAGVALHHWQKTGNFLPGLMPDPEIPVESGDEVLEEE